MDEATPFTLFTREDTLGYKPNHLPKGFAEAYAKVKAGQCQSVEKNFFTQGGFPAWAAYRLVLRTLAGKNYGGKASDQRLFDSLSQLSDEEQSDLARQVSLATGEKFSDMQNKLDSPGSTWVTPQKRPWEAVPTLERENIITYQSETIHDALASSALDIEATQVDGRFSHAHPPVERLSKLDLPFTLENAITRARKSPGQPFAAGITMLFFDEAYLGRKAGSVMTLSLLSKKVQHLAYLLFGVQLESDNQFRYLVLGGTKISSNADLVFRGCSCKVIDEVFGKNVSKAIKASPAYQQERELAVSVTDCISLNISRIVKEPCTLNLILDEREGVRLKVALFD